VSPLPLLRARPLLVLSLAGAAPPIHLRRAIDVEAVGVFGAGNSVRRDQRRERHHLAIVVAYVILFDVALAEALFTFCLKEDAPLPAKND